MPVLHKILSDPFGFIATVPWGRRRELTTPYTRLRAVDPFGQAARLCFVDERSVVEFIGCSFTLPANSSFVAGSNDCQYDAIPIFLGPYASPKPSMTFRWPHNAFFKVPRRCQTVSLSACWPIRHDSAVCVFHLRCRNRGRRRKSCCAMSPIMRTVNISAETASYAKGECVLDCSRRKGTYHSAAITSCVGKGVRKHRGEAGIGLHSAL
jgi:hypothetical protein